MHARLLSLLLKNCVSTCMKEYLYNCYTFIWLFINCLSVPLLYVSLTIVLLSIAGFVIIVIIQPLCRHLLIPTSISCFVCPSIRLILVLYEMISQVLEWKRYRVALKISIIMLDLINDSELIVWKNCRKIENSLRKRRQIMLIKWIQPVAYISIASANYQNLNLWLKGSLFWWSLIPKILENKQVASQYG